MTATAPREVRLAKRPEGWPKDSDFELAQSEPRDLQDGEIRVRNIAMSVDPYMRGRMNDRKSYAPPYEIGKAMWGGAVGEVVESKDPTISVGQSVGHEFGWREESIVSGNETRPIDTTVVSYSAYLGVLGMPGQTAYVGLTRIMQINEGDIFFVSGAAGAVGSVAGQIAKILGASKVIGSAGSPEKVAYVKGELDFDEVFNYHDGPVAEQLAKAAPDGIDCYFDNVGTEHLEAAIGALRLHGRIALCGSISTYNDVEPKPGPRNVSTLVGNRGRMEGFIVRDHEDIAAEYWKRAAGWLEDGSLKTRETFVDGIDNAAAAFVTMLKGGNTGKMIVRLQDLL